MDNYISAVILGVIEGATEFLPVSSTGHLIIAGEALSVGIDSSKSFEIFIQLGAILSVISGLWERRGWLFTSKPSYCGIPRGLGLVGVACIPAFILGALLHGFIKTYLFSPKTVAIGLLTGSVLFVFAEYVAKKNSNNRKLVDITLKDSILIGISQCFALWPGFSRSGATICGGLLLGFKRKDAAEFSFLVAVPVMSGAVIYDLYQSNLLSMNSQLLIIFIIGFVVSYIVALASIKFLLRIFETYSLLPFAIYRVILSAVILLWQFG